MIPKTIHYCWFGGNPLPESAKKCIASWKEFFPEYEIKEWNEDNFDFKNCKYCKEAYQKKKWAFVSDYARFWILYNYGGIYFDTDVEIIKDMSDIINYGPFMGCEVIGKCAPGLGLGVNPGNKLYKEIIDFYDKIHFIKSDGTINEDTVVTYVTDILKKYGFKQINEIQKIEDIYIYPPDFFCPLNYETGNLKITKNTRSIHHYSASWHSRLDKIIKKIELCDKEKKTLSYRIRRCISLPFRIINKVKKNGITRTLSFIKKYFN